MTRYRILRERITMTSGTGKGGISRGRHGFTLVEIMVVMAILVMLFGLIAVSIGSLTNKAADKATSALIQKVQTYLDEYHRLTGHYPPDGIDSPVETDDGETIQGSACLYYFLARKSLLLREMHAGKKSIKEVKPLGRFLATELAPEDSDLPDVRELVDGWGTPMHYDNTENEKFVPQRGDVHREPLDDDLHPVDPREGNLVVHGANAVAEPGIQGEGYDLWSHGPPGHDMDEEPTLPVASWSLEL
jgi:prepilin-type N-terminal cleavage/methylation domain-containing protein